MIVSDFESGRKLRTKWGVWDDIWSESGGLSEVSEKVKMRENKVDGDTFTCLCAFGSGLKEWVWAIRLTEI